MAEKAQRELRNLTKIPRIAKNHNFRKFVAERKIIKIVFVFNPGARFSNVPKTFRVCKAIFNCRNFKNKEVYRHETLHEGKICSY